MRNHIQILCVAAMLATLSIAHAYSGPALMDPSPTSPTSPTPPTPKPPAPKPPTPPPPSPPKDITFDAYSFGRVSESGSLDARRVWSLLWTRIDTGAALESLVHEVGREGRR